MGGWWSLALVSPDGVAPSWMVGVSASLNLPLHHEVQKFSSGTGSPGWSQKKGRKMVICVCVYLQHQASPMYKPPLSTSIHSLYSSEWTSRSLVQLSLCAVVDLHRLVYKTDTSMLVPVCMITNLTERGTVSVLGYKLGP